MSTPSHLPSPPPTFSSTMFNAPSSNNSTNNSNSNSTTANSTSSSQLPQSIQEEIHALTAELSRVQPSDVLQYCANFFNHRLESQRSQFLASHGHKNKAANNNPTTKQFSNLNAMSESSFPGVNPFGNKSKNVNKIDEEEEEENDQLASPTQSSFKQNDSGPSSRSPFGGAGFGAGSPFTNNPFGGSSGNADHADEDLDPAAYRPSGTSPPPAASAGLPTNYALGRRTSVSAESLAPTSSGTDNWVPPSHPKTEAQLGRLRVAVQNNFLFKQLDDNQLQTVLSALVEKPIPAKDIKVIAQGDAGDFFYIVEEGEFDIHIHSSGSVQAGADGLGAKVASIGSGGSFGELALMYNAPRAATVVSTSPKSVLWALDRVTFRRILMDSAFDRRRMYESFLTEVPLLSSLKPYERSKVADALDTQKYPAGTTIIREGDPGDAFYMLEAGEAEAFKQGKDGAVRSYSRGDYFGELALLDDKPRAASVVAKTEVTLAKLDRDGFKRLLGPVENVMRREEYDIGPLAQPGSPTV